MYSFLVQKDVNIIIWKYIACWLKQTVQYSYIWLLSRLPESWHPLGASNQYSIQSRDAQILTTINKLRASISMSLSTLNLENNIGTDNCTMYVTINDTYKSKSRHKCTVSKARLAAAIAWTVFTHSAYIDWFPMRGCGSRLNAVGSFTATRAVIATATADSSRK